MVGIVRNGNLVPIPPELAEEYNLHEGSRVDWVRTTDGSWTLHPARTQADMARSLLGAGSKYIKPGESGVENFLRLRQENAEGEGNR